MLQTIWLKTSVLKRSLLPVDHSSLHDVWLRRERDSADCNNFTGESSLVHKQFSNSPKLKPNLTHNECLPRTTTRTLYLTLKATTITAGSSSSRAIVAVLEPTWLWKPAQPILSTWTVILLFSTRRKPEHSQSCKQLVWHPPGHIISFTWPLQGPPQLFPRQCRRVHGIIHLLLVKTQQCAWYLSTLLLPPTKPPNTN
jgi:hypothetical protein